jgi:hypothetical protein
MTEIELFAQFVVGLECRDPLTAKMSSSGGDPAFQSVRLETIIVTLQPVARTCLLHNAANQELALSFMGSRYPLRAAEIVKRDP